MHDLVSQMLERYSCQTSDDYRNALKEILQELTLFALSRSDFFQHAAFYGGTALRIFYGLDRFSEDLDFSLKAPAADFDLHKYLPLIESEINAQGFQVEVVGKEKSLQTAVQSAFVKGNTIIQLVHFIPDMPHIGLHRDEKVRVKFEVDTNPPEGAGYEQKFSLQPIPYAVTLYDKPSLFAGKIHAVLCRKWKNRNKGRDFYDYVWYLQNRTPVNLLHLQRRLEQTGNWPEGETLTRDHLKELLRKRFSDIDFEAAKQDVLPFIRHPESLSLWSADFFTGITEQYLSAETKK